MILYNYKMLEGQLPVPISKLEDDKLYVVQFWLSPFYRVMTGKSIKNQHMQTNIIVEYTEEN